MRYLHQERGYYYFRSRIPKDLQEYFGCSKVKKTLGTKDFKTALVSVKLLSHELFRVIQIMRSGVLSKKQMDSLVRDFFSEHLKNREYSSLMRDDKRDEAYRKKRIQECDSLLEQYNYHLNEKRDHYDDILTDFLKSHDIVIERTSYEFLKLRQNFIVALIKATEIEKERVQGNFNNWYDDFHALAKRTSSLPDSPDGKIKGKPLSEVVDIFIQMQIANKAWKAKDLKEHTDFYNQFVQIIGDKDIAKYSEKDAIRAYKILQKFPANWKKKKGLREKPLTQIISLIEKGELDGFDVVSDTTLKKYLVWIRSVFNHARVTNYFSDFKIRKKQKASRERDPYSKEELQKWLDSPVYTKWTPERVRKNPEYFWVPLTVLLCGMRPREVCQLYQEDIKQEDNIWYFDINPQEDKSVKTLESERLVPIHPTLIKLGFLRYCKSQKHKRIFPSLTNAGEGEGYAESYNKWAGRYNRQHITTEKKKVPYSMRHNFSTFLTNLPNVKESLADEITGHVREGEVRGRYAQYSLKNKHDAIVMVDYGLDFSSVKYPFTL